MTFESFSEQYSSTIDRALDQYLNFGCTGTQNLLKDAMHYSLTAPAKRVRPLLVLATYHLFQTDISRILPLAASIEMVHTYSLIHDDLPAMDNDSLRRGQPTCHVKFGEDMAILAGDTLNSYSFELIAQELPKFYPAEIVIHVIRELGEAYGILGMAGGQVMDLHTPKTFLNRDEKAAYLRKTHALKTGAILERCVTLPAALENALPEEQKALKTFSTHLGLLFQIVDDILDVKGASGDLGKSAGKDSAQNKLTYVTLFGLENAQALAQEEANSALEALTLIPERDTEILADFARYFLTRTQ